MTMKSELQFSEKEKAEVWTHHTANLWWGCTKVHEGCDHCYAETLSNRWGNSVWGNDVPRKEIKKAFSDLDKYQKAAEKAGEIHRVFVGSMMDIFEKPMPLIGREYTTEHLRWLLFANIDFGKYNNLDFLLLTKRPSNINKYTPQNWKTNPPKNVMFGASVVNQSTFDTVLRQLQDVNGRKFLSMEPQLSGIDFNGHVGEVIDWIIQGGESGPKKRPFDLMWARHMRDLCYSHNIPYFFKQIDKVQEIPEDLQIREFPQTLVMAGLK